MGRTNYEIRNVGKPDENKKAVCKGWEKKILFSVTYHKIFFFSRECGTKQKFCYIFAFRGSNEPTNKQGLHN